jgi:nitrite reductase/ring-hydroxylating ferredoxin subunit
LTSRQEGQLDRLSDLLGNLARTNSEAPLGSVIPYGAWKKHPDQSITSPGSVAITSAIWPDVARMGSRLYTFDGLCAHEHSPLSAGMLQGTTIMCQCHGSTYDLRTGAVLRGPTAAGLAVYEVREHHGAIQIKV